MEVTPVTLKGYDMIINEELKDALLDMILDLDSHFPAGEVDNKYYERFYEKYIKLLTNYFQCSSGGFAGYSIKVRGDI